MNLFGGNISGNFPEKIPVILSEVISELTYSNYDKEAILKS